MENSPFGRLIGVLVAPGKTFRAIAERPTWLVAFLVVVLCPLLPGIFAAPKIDWEEVARTQIERSPMDVPPEAAEQQIEVTKKIGPFLVYMGPFFFALAVLFFALVLWGAFALAGGELNFPRSLAVVSHGMMPVVVASLLSVPVILGMDAIPGELLEQGSYLRSSLAAIAPEGANVALVAMLSKLDVFSVWTVVLLIIGFAPAAKVKPSTSAITVGVLWLLYVGISVGLASLPLLFGGKG